MRTISLFGPKGTEGTGRVALVDDEDYDLVMQYRWNVYEKIRTGTRSNGPYAQAPVYLEDGRQTSVRMHKLITGWPMTDHIDGNGLNNQRSNLRPANQSQQSMNRRSFVGASSRYKGVSQRRPGAWTASIQVNGKQTWLGTFDDELTAALVRDAAARQLHGEYAYLNFPDGHKGM